MRGDIPIIVEWSTETGWTKAPALMPRRLYQMPGKEGQRMRSDWVKLRVIGPMVKTTAWIWEEAEEVAK